MAYDKDTIKVVSVPISIEAHEILLEIAAKEKRTMTSQAGYLLENLLISIKQKGVI